MTASVYRDDCKRVSGLTFIAESCSKIVLCPKPWSSYIVEETDNIRCQKECDDICRAKHKEGFYNNGQLSCHTRKSEAEMDVDVMATKKQCICGHKTRDKKGIEPCLPALDISDEKHALDDCQAYCKASLVLRYVRSDINQVIECLPPSRKYKFYKLQGECGKKLAAHSQQQVRRECFCGLLPPSEMSNAIVAHNPISVLPNISLNVTISEGNLKICSKPFPEAPAEVSISRSNCDTLCKKTCRNDTSAFYDDDKLICYHKRAAADMTITTSESRGIDYCECGYNESEPFPALPRSVYDVYLDGAKYFHKCYPTRFRKPMSQLNNEPSVCSKWCHRIVVFTAHTYAPSTSKSNMVVTFCTKEKSRKLNPAPITGECLQIKRGNAREWKCSCGTPRKTTDTDAGKKLTSDTNNAQSKKRHTSPSPTEKEKRIRAESAPDKRKQELRVEDISSGSSDNVPLIVYARRKHLVNPKAQSEKNANISNENSTSKGANDYSFLNPSFQKNISKKCPILGSQSPLKTSENDDANLFAGNFMLPKKLSNSRRARSAINNDRSCVDTELNENSVGNVGKENSKKDSANNDARKSPSLEESLRMGLQFEKFQLGKNSSREILGRNDATTVLKSRHIRVKSIEDIMIASTKTSNKKVEKNEKNLAETSKSIPKNKPKSPFTKLATSAKIDLKKAPGRESLISRLIQSKPPARDYSAFEFENLPEGSVEGSLSSSRRKNKTKKDTSDKKRNEGLNATDKSRCESAIECKQNLQSNSIPSVENITISNKKTNIGKSSSPASNIEDSFSGGVDKDNMPLSQLLSIKKRKDKNSLNLQKVTSKRVNNPNEESENSKSCDSSRRNNPKVSKTLESDQPEYCKVPFTMINPNRQSSTKVNKKVPGQLIRDFSEYHIRSLINAPNAQTSSGEPSMLLKYKKHPICGNLPNTFPAESSGSKIASNEPSFSKTKKTISSGSQSSHSDSGKSKDVAKRSKNIRLSTDSTQSSRCLPARLNLDKNKEQPHAGFDLNVPLVEECDSPIAFTSQNIVAGGTDVPTTDNTIVHHRATSPSLPSSPSFDFYVQNTSRCNSPLIASDSGSGKNNKTPSKREVDEKQTSRNDGQTSGQHVNEGRMSRIDANERQMIRSEVNEGQTSRLVNEGPMSRNQVNKEQRGNKLQTPKMKEIISIDDEEDDDDIDDDKWLSLG